LWVYFDKLTIHIRGREIEVEIRHMIQALAVKDHGAPELAIFVKEHQVYELAILRKVELVPQHIDIL
jgi:hypothetical protein